MDTTNRTQSGTTWRNTTLWQCLEKCERPDAHDVALVLESWLPDIEAVLKSGGTAPLDFTLHDHSHAFRVAQRMVQIIPETTLEALSPYELAFLILSAYLHDIGMTPEYRKVSLHYQYLLSGDNRDLTQNEVDSFQTWLDDDQGGLTPPLCKGTPTRDELRRATRLMAHYCRARHNDWSADWIHSHRPIHDHGLIPLGSFADWIGDLIRLCQSHHQGRDELSHDSFNPRLVGAHGQILHLRYLACALRVADVLEFDPERTPEAVLSHRDVSLESVIYWHKDHAFSPRFEDARLILSARPHNAWLYRAVEEMLDQIDVELYLCRSLADETHFEMCPGLKELHPYHWTLAAAVHRDLAPEPGSFIYINSAFRPNTEKILQIFSGLELYGRPLAAVRELLQNAFDAVRERIAYQRLHQPIPGDATLEMRIASLHRVILELEQRDGKYWLVCTDSGVGMNKRIIENYLLVAGQARRHDLLALERQCRAKGFSTGRTGKFGLGVLSYFMIADHLRIFTRRSLEAADADGHGWVVETDGIGSWGELRNANNLDVGSRVELQLKHKLFGPDRDWPGTLITFLKELLVRIPCHLHIKAESQHAGSLALDAGWIRDRDLSSNDALAGLRAEHDSESVDFTLLPAAVSRQAWERNQFFADLRSKALPLLRWIEDAGEFPDGVGRYRIMIPYFDLLGGPSFDFLDAT